jgi:hypothetical protein
MYEVEVPKEFIVVHCDGCDTDHAPIRDCPEPGTIWDTNAFPYED